MAQSESMLMAGTPAATGLTYLASPSGAALRSPFCERLWPAPILICLMVSALTCGVIWFAVRPMYRVSATVRVTPLGTAGSSAYAMGVAPFQQEVATEATNLSHPNVLRAAAEASRGQTADAPADPLATLTERLEITPVAGTQLIEVSMTGDRARAMAAMVNAVVAEYLAQRERQVEDRRARIVETLTDEERDLSARLVTLAVRREEVYAAGGVAPGESTQTLDTRIGTLRERLSDIAGERALAESRSDALRSALHQQGTVAHVPEELDAFWHKDRDLIRLHSAIDRLVRATSQDERLGRLPSHPEVRERLDRITLLQRRVRIREEALRKPFLADTIETFEKTLGDLAVTQEVVVAELDALERQREIAWGQSRRLATLDDQGQRIESDLGRIRQGVRDVRLEESRRLEVAIQRSATAPTMPNIDPRPRYMAAIGVAGLLLGLSLAFVRQRAGRSFRDPQRLAQALGFNVAGYARMPACEGLTLPMVDAGRLALLRHGGLVERPVATCVARSRTVTAASATSGRSSLAFGLARRAAARGWRVLFIDANSQQVRAKDASVEDSVVGLAGWLDGSMTREDILPPASDRLVILPIGRSETGFAHLLSDWHAQVRFFSLFEGFDDVIVAAPPVGHGSDALAIAALTDEVILVVTSGRRGRRDAVRARRQLATLAVNVVAVVDDSDGA